MNATEMVVPYGSQWRMARPVGDVEVIITPDREVELAASFLPDRNVSRPQTQMATSLAIHMDHAVAVSLLLKLHETFQTMGWHMPEEGECQI